MKKKAFSSPALGAVFVQGTCFGDCSGAAYRRAYDIGIVVNPKIARSQCIGGMASGLGMALMEQVEWETHLGRVMNVNLAEYPDADERWARDLDVLLVPSEGKTFNPVGSKGVAEIALLILHSVCYDRSGNRQRPKPPRLS